MSREWPSVDPDAGLVLVTITVRAPIRASNVTWLC